MDQGDPNVTSLLGDTPGPLGVLDCGDPTLPFLSANACLLGGVVQTEGGIKLAMGNEARTKPPVVKDPKVWGDWAPPADYASLFAMLSSAEGEGYYDYMYLDTQNLVTVGVGTCLRAVSDAKALRFYRRDTLLAATAEEITKAYDAVLAAKPAKDKKPFVASHYADVTALSMTPTDIGERWLADVKEFQRQLPTYFKGFAKYPADAVQAITDIAYQYGAAGAATNAAGGAIKTAAEDGDWALAGTLCAKLTYASATRNANRKKLFDAAAAAQPKAKEATRK